MPSALVGAVSCGRCATPHAVGASRCTGCGAPQAAPAAGSALRATGSVLAGVAAAAPARRRLAVAIDAAVVLVVAAGAGTVVLVATAGLRERPLLVAAAAVLAAAVVVAALTAVLARTGRTAGRATIGLRTVDTLTGLPPAGAGTALAAVLTGRSATVLTADLRRGREPQALTLAPVALGGDDGAAAAPDAEAVAPASLLAPVEAPAVRLVLDSGDEVVVQARVLLGRDPEPRGGVRELHALPDLSRGIARTHLLVEWANGLAWVTDLHTANGTAVAGPDGGVQPLVPGQRTAVGYGSVVRLGGRSFTVRSAAATEGTRG